MHVLENRLTSHENSPVQVLVTPRSLFFVLPEPHMLHDLKFKLSQRKEVEKPLTDRLGKLYKFQCIMLIRLQLFEMRCNAIWRKALRKMTFTRYVRVHRDKSTSTQPIVQNYLRT